MTAWLIKWNWIGDHAAVEQPVVAVLSARTPAETVRRYIEFCHTVARCSLREQVEQARYNMPAEHVYRAEFDRVDGAIFQGRIVCGHNPFLEACPVENLRLVPDGNGGETLAWDPIRQRRRA